MSSHTPLFQDIINIIKTQFPNDSTIPLHAPTFQGNEKKYVLDCIDSTFVSSVGQYVTQFETMIQNFTNAKHAIATVNGTAALHISLLLAGVNDNTEVITQPLTFIATCNAIRYCNAHPIFVDISPDTFSLCPDKLHHFLSQSTQLTTKGLINKQTGRLIKACIPMHTFGHPAKIKEIIDVCNEFHLPVIEDAAESLGSYYHNQHTGTFGLLGVFSFNGNKIITTGGGGMIVTNDPALAKKAKHITTTAKQSHPWEYEHDMVGYNFRLPNINAALGCAQMEMLDSFISKKRQLASQYKEQFKKLNISFVTEPLNCHSNYWLNTLIFNNESERDTFLTMSNDQNVITRPCWKLMTELTMYQNCFHSDLSNAVNYVRRIVNIGSSVIA